MKSILFLVTMGITAFFTAGNSDLIVDVVNSFRKKDASIMANHFNSSLEIEIPGNKGVYSSGQAKMILQQYLSNNGVTNPKVSHSGNSANGSKFAIIDFTANMIKKQAKVYFNTSSKISEIKIE